MPILFYKRALLAARNGGKTLSDIILKMTNISKSFGPVKALDNANLQLKKGEVHALVGENGAGKSTMMKILTGIHSKDEGTITYDGQDVNFKNIRESQEAGIAIVHQELNMMQHLTAAQNIFIGRESMKYRFITDDYKINQKAAELFELLDTDINPQEKVANLTVGRRQMIEIAKAISMDAKVIVFDEPTAALTEAETESLFKIINDLKSRGIGIIYISHRMDEIDAITDRITVLRDGQFVDRVHTKETTRDKIINMMVGRTIMEEPKEKSEVEPDAEVTLSVRNLSRGDEVKDVSFDLHRGEILGFSGLMGAGRTEVARLIFGADKKNSGEIYLHGKKVNITSPEDAVQLKIGYLSEDRKDFGVIVDQTVANNTALPSLDKYEDNLLLNDKKIEKTAEEYIESLGIVTPSAHQLVRNLSGGNQQKVVIAKWLVKDCDILIFDEPTRGIDVGAKSEIYTLINELAKSGKSIIMISSELPEVLRMSDRIIVMCEGRKTKELLIEEATQEKIIHYATLRNGGNLDEAK